MPISIRSKTRSDLTDTARKAKAAKAEWEKAQREKAIHIAKLKALRLAKEAAEETTKGKKKPPRLPQVHRQQS